MEIIQRIFNPKDKSKRKSIFLFGPRQTGKSTLLRETLKGVKTYNLLDRRLFTELSRRPDLIRKELTGDDELVVIDEVQKLPELLDEVQLMIEEHGIRFILTGSSSRTLKRKGTNLLGGRARSYHLHPLVSHELKNSFSYVRAMERGLLPSMYDSDEPTLDLRSYVGDYLKEEVSAEAKVRNIGAFSRFLEVAALAHTQMINYSRVSADAEVPLSTVREHFQILKDTYLGYSLPAFSNTVKRKPIGADKFYFFDNGIVRGILGQFHPLKAGTVEFGVYFEGLIFHELKSYCDYNDQLPLRYWRSKSNFKVDFILNDEIAIECKAKSTIREQDLRGLRALREEGLMKKYYIVSLLDRSQSIDGIEILTLKDFLEKLWSQNLL